MIPQILGVCLHTNVRRIYMEMRSGPKPDL